MSAPKKKRPFLGPKKRRPGPGRPPAHVQAQLAKGRASVFEARRLLMEAAAAAARTKIKAMQGKLLDSDARTMDAAADSILKKVGIGDTQKVDVTMDPPVVVRFGGMEGFPTREASGDGVEPDGSMRGPKEGAK